MTVNRGRQAFGVAPQAALVEAVANRSGRPPRAMRAERRASATAAAGQTFLAAQMGRDMRLGFVFAPGNPALEAAGEAL